MRRLFPFHSFVFVGLGLAGLAALTASDASAKRIRLGGGTPVYVAKPKASSATTAPVAATTAPAAVDISKDREAAQASAIQRAQAKLAAERGAGGMTTNVVSEQVNTSAGGNTLVCIAGCYK